MSLYVSPKQLEALKTLGEPWHYQVNWKPNLTQGEYGSLLAAGLIAEAWTWASRTRPDVCITDKGASSRAAGHP